MCVCVCVRVGVCVGVCMCVCKGESACVTIPPLLRMPGCWRGSLCVVYVCTACGYGRYKTAEQVMLIELLRLTVL